MTYGEAAAVMFEGSGGSKLKTEEISITENRRYTPSDGYDAISKATVSVPIEEYTYGSIMDACLSTDSVFSWQLKDFGDNNYHMEIHTAKIPQIRYSVNSTTLYLSEYYMDDYVYIILFRSGIPLWAYCASLAPASPYYYPRYNTINSYCIDSIQWSGTEYDDVGWYVVRHSSYNSYDRLYIPSLTVNYTCAQYKEDSTRLESYTSTGTVELIKKYSGVYKNYDTNLYFNAYNYYGYTARSMATDLGYTELLNEITDFYNYFKEQL